VNRRPLRFVALAYAAVVLWATVGPAPWRTRSNQLEGGILNPDAWTAPVTWTTGYLSEMAFNVAMFVPVGLLAALLIPRRRWPLALLAGFAFTAVIELVQVPEPDRISDPRDLVMNSAGAVLGVLLVLTARMVRRSVAVAAMPVITPADDTRSSTAAPTTTDAPVPASPDASASEGELVGSPSRIQ
jgi:glycopeptide antibiotics resistance protein